MDLNLNLPLALALMCLTVMTLPAQIVINEFSCSNYSLNIAGNNIGNKGATAITKALKVTGSLTELDLQDNNLDESAKAALRTAARPALELYMD